MSALPPATEYPGAVPTMNGRGYMLETLDEYTRYFIDTAAGSRGEALDIGCAYGIATIAALEKGARVCACDMEPKHLAIVRERTPEALRGNLRTVIGLLPEVDFPDGSFSAILAARVLHFLNGEDFRQALTKMHRWLVPGGRLIITADSPYMPGWRAIVPAYEAAKAKGEAWPGFIADFPKYTSQAGGGVAYLNTLDPDILARECAQAGFTVERAAFFPMERLGDQSIGREHAGCIAQREGNCQEILQYNIRER